MQVIHRKKNIFLEKYGFFSDSDLFITYYENFKLCAVQSLIPRCFHSSENRRTFSEQHDSTCEDAFESVTTSEMEKPFFSPDWILVAKEAPKLSNQTKGSNLRLTRFIYGTIRGNGVRDFWLLPFQGAEI